MKIISRILIVLICAALLYSTAMYGYVWLQMQPLTPLSAPSAAASLSSRPQVHMIHAVNSQDRALAKDARYEGFELDLNRVNGHLRVAHDQTHFNDSVALENIFSSVKHPEQKTWWIDLKTNLTQEDIDYLKTQAQRFNISPRRMLFETSGGDTADLLKQNGFPILLSVIDGFNEDDGNAEKRAQLNAQMEELVRRYQPFAIAGSLGKYPYLKAYFPNYNKAIYSATTVRPSLKKKFLKQAMFKDPTVLVFMQDEYTWLPF